VTEHLAETINRFITRTLAHDGVASTDIPGMSLLRASNAGEVRHEIQRPLLCLVAQGAKEITVAGQSRKVRAGSSMVITANVPTITRILDASPDSPYLSFALYLDPPVIADLAVSTQPSEGQTQLPDTETEIADVARRMIRLHDRRGAYRAR